MNPIYRFFVYADVNRFTRWLNDTKRGFIQTQTGITANSQYDTSGRINVVPGERILYNTFTSVGFYASDNSLVQYIAGDLNKRESVLIVPSGVTYCRVCVLSSKFDSIQVNGIRQTNPNYKDDLAKEYNLENNQRFFRASLSGKLSFIGADYDYINDTPFETVYGLILEKSDDNGKTWNIYFRGKFAKTDCEFDDDDKILSVQPEVVDSYNDVLAGLEKEYNLIPLAPAIDRVLLKKRPLIQVYIPGDNIVSCFLGGTYWEQDANEVWDRNALISTYHFALCNLLKEVNITVSGTPSDASGLYAGSIFASGTTLTGELYKTGNFDYVLKFEQKKEYNFHYWLYVATVQLIRVSDNKVLFEYVSGEREEFENKDFTMTAKNGATGTARAEMATYNIFARYLLDVDSIEGVGNTYPLPWDDIVGNNRNYKRAIGYAIDIANISNRFSTTPTEWGRADNGLYFTPPYSIWGQRFYPIARSKWRYASIWFGFAFGDEYFETKCRKTYTLRDAFPVWSCINQLLKQFAPEITHEGTPEYSQFLYGNYNPISYQWFRLYVAQKSNILAGDYSQPAQKAPATLQQFLNMLRDCYRCYWYIEDNKLKIEHVEFFRNGGSYTGGQIIGIDSTQMYNPRNGKKLSFDTSKWSYDKLDMPERFQFNWADDVTQAFEGFPIEVKSKYVQAGKIEDISLSAFTSDIDMMLLNPSEMSMDGFALLSVIKANAILKPDNLYTGSHANSGQLSVYPYVLRPECLGQNAIIVGNATADDGGVARFRVVFYNGSEVISRQGDIIFTNYTSTNINISIPNNATSVGFESINGGIFFRVYKVETTTQYELPIIEREVDRTTYFLQNGHLAFINLQPLYYVYDMPARSVVINVEYTTVQIDRKLKQTITLPSGDNDPNPMQLIKTEIGNGQIEKININLHSRSAKINLRYDTDTEK